MDLHVKRLDLRVKGVDLHVNHLHLRVKFGVK